jgi:hypothetical protein
VLEIFATVGPIIEIFGKIQVITQLGLFTTRRTHTDHPDRAASPVLADKSAS